MTTIPEERSRALLRSKTNAMVKALAMMIIDQKGGSNAVAAGEISETLRISKDTVTMRLAIAD